MDDPRIPRAIPGASCRKSGRNFRFQGCCLPHVEDALLDLTNRSDIVVDPFLGSGSTLIAADKTGRVCRGLEFDPLYVDVIVRRYEAGAIPRRRLRPPRSPTFESSDPTECC